MQVADGDLEVVLSGLAHTPNVDGVLITMPHKFSAFAQCTSSSPTSQLLGGVNVMRRNPDRTWHGDMLDGLAFVKAQVDAGARPDGARVLLLGAGGAGSAIAIALLAAGVRTLIVHDTDASRVARLMLALDEPDDRLAPGPADPSGCDMVCNATPMGMADDDPLPLAPELLTSAMFVGDVIAGHGVTPLLRAATDAGCMTASGDQMVSSVQDLMIEFFLGKSR
jgi:shikimate dehydrogenase